MHSTVDVLERDPGRCFNTLQSSCGSSLYLCTKLSTVGWSLNNVKAPGVVQKQFPDRNAKRLVLKFSFICLNWVLDA